MFPGEIGGHGISETAISDINKALINILKLAQQCHRYGSRSVLFVGLVAQQVEQENECSRKMNTVAKLYRRQVLRSPHFQGRWQYFADSWQILTELRLSMP